MGRHTAVHRHSPLRLPLLVLTLTLVTGAVAWTTVAVVRSGAGCGSPVTVVVAAAPDVAPALTSVAHGLGVRCATVDVRSRADTDVAQQLSGPDTGLRPQVWVPQSTLALRRARQLGASDVPDTGTPVASSPVVLAVTEPVARAAGWPGRELTWADVLAQPSAVTGMADPAEDPVGTLALPGLEDSVQNVADPPAAYAALLRRFSANTQSAQSDLLARQPGADAGGGAATVFPVSENSLLRHNSAPGAGPLVAMYSAATAALDYPFAELGGISDAQRPIVDALLAAALGAPGQDAVAGSGLRAAGMQPLRSDVDDQHVDAAAQQGARLPSVIEADDLLTQWAGINLSARVQVLIDVSGSMNAQVPGTGLNRIQVTLQAAEKAMHLFKPTTEVRVLTFATHLDGDKDYREVLPMAPVGEELAGGALTRLAQVRATPDGGTGLYDSVLDVYRTARREWEPGRLNLVIVMTDGRNDDPAGITRGELLSQLRGLQDPPHPVPLIGVGIGPDADKAELDQITAPTGGEAFLTDDPAKITDVFFAALSRLAGG